ncbi:MAG: TonB-dependent receptor [Bacteroidales bacterium]|nr:TonB-dependent receptor [Bacteroidales bacterium]
MKLKLSILIILLFTTIHLTSQNIVEDSVYTLTSVNISGTRLNDFSVGLKVDKIDSLVLDIYRSSSIGDVLNSQTPIYIKSYGQGSLATISFRGTSANHTGIYLNGFNINAPNIGMTDLSLIPIFFFKSIEVQHGGASSLFGSGNIGGAIHLNNQPEFNNNKKINLGVSIGSFSDYSSHVKFSRSWKNFYSSTGLLICKSKNDFEFKNLLNEKEKQKNSALFQYGIIQELGFKLSANQILNALVWFQFNEKEIPKTLTSKPNDALQTDKSLRSSLQWKKYTANGSVIAKAAYFNNNLHYNDPDTIQALNIDSKIKTQTIISEFQIKKEFIKNLKFDAGANFTLNIGETINYEKTESQKQVGMFISVVKCFPGIEWSSNLNIRQDLIEGYNVPITPSLGFEGKIWSFLYGRLNISKNFRAPTFNERFWIPGGNENLKPETSWNEEAGIIFKLNKEQKKHSEFSITAYNTIIDNWILWIPQDNFFTVENIQKVWARGIELQGKTKLFIGKFNFNITGGYTYSLSTNQKKVSANDESYKKQLIYVPEHNFYANIIVIFRYIVLNYNQTYTGKCYISRDNTKSIPGYSLGNISLSKRIKFKKQFLKIQFDINNLWDKEYQAIQYYPMPGRWYKVSVVFYN